MNNHQSFRLISNDEDKDKDDVYTNDKNKQHYSSAQLSFCHSPRHHTHPSSYYDHQTFTSTPSAFSPWETERQQHNHHYHHDYRRIYPPWPPSAGPPPARPRVSFTIKGAAADERNHEGISSWPPKKSPLTSSKSNYDGEADEKRNRQKEKQHQLKIQHDDQYVYKTQPPPSTSWNVSHKYGSQRSHDKASQTYQYKQDHNAIASLEPIQRSTFAFTQPPSHFPPYWYNEHKFHAGPPLAAYDLCPQLPRSNRHQNASPATHESEDNETSISVSTMAPLYPNIEVEGTIIPPAAYFPAWDDKQEETSTRPDNVSKKRKIGRQQEYEFDKYHRRDDDGHESSIGTMFAAPSTTTLRSTQSRNISSRIEDERSSPRLHGSYWDSFSLFPGSMSNNKSSHGSSILTGQRHPDSSRTWHHADPLQIVEEKGGMPNETKKSAQRTHNHEIRNAATTDDKETSILITNATKTKSGQRKKQHVKDKRSTLLEPPTSTAANDEYGFHNLLALPDYQLTTSFTTQIFDELKIVFFEEGDRRNNRAHLSLGFAGFACRHCKRPAGRGGRYFPSTMKTLTDTHKTLFAINKHFAKCISCPDDIKTNLKHLLTQHASEKGMLKKKKIGQISFFDKIWDILRSKETIEYT